jgi:ketosteroid isomerase-like protein
MSQENVELARRICASLDQGRDILCPGLARDYFRFLPAPHRPGRSHGLEQARAWGERERQMWEAGRVYWQPEELIDAGDKVVALIRTGGRGKASGVDVSAHVWNVWTFRDGKPVEWMYFGDDREAAFAAAGLPEQDAHHDAS